MEGNMWGNGRMGNIMVKELKLTLMEESYVGESKDNEMWNGTKYDKDGKIIYKVVNGKQKETITPPNPTNKL